MDEEFNTPVLLILFNRPGHARRVLNRIRERKVRNLYVAVDGPRINNIDDKNNVEECIKLSDEIDWPCVVTKLVRERNLGCRSAVSSAIDWFFSKVEEGIILEDDCLPDLSFFAFCHELLGVYVNEPKVMHIAGANIYKKQVWSDSTYFFSNIPHIWGWATWRRAWKLYDVNMHDYHQFRDSGIIEKIVNNPQSVKYWYNEFNGTYLGKIDTWDYQWVYTIWKNQGLCIIPNQNLITNIGFDEHGTHTVVDSDIANLPTVAINVKTIKHPEILEINKDAVKYAFANLYQLPSWWKTKISNLKRRLF
ncbi:hypothetical protein CLV58_13343 [Spirosoma oryzae]|uniref:Nucleotide-diphospho-sugar transferase n=1 Tax=Spirosoma oryzae TaxID=1469603 RepID=A0A2T0S1X9_9BACT|nr:nucleotide-diphospho-sugar transferase [Spirosoma oryzae]PRY27410.1 hypothetical protein CLV58_13343 [Spirosoma oryzae]